VTLPQNGAIAIDNLSNICIVGYTKGELDGNANSGVVYAQDDMLGTSSYSSTTQTATSSEIGH